MKRLRDNSVRKSSRLQQQQQRQQPRPRVSLPLELLGVIAEHMQLETVADIFAFMLICRATSTQFLAPALRHWAVCCLAPSLRRGQREAQNREVDVLRDYLERHTDSERQLVERINHMRSQTQQEWHTFLLALFDLQKQALLDAYWTRTIVRTGRILAGGHACTHLQLYDPAHAIARIADVYHYDGDGVAPLCHLPGLRVAVMPADLKKPMRAIHAALVQRYGSDASLQTVIYQGLRHLGLYSPRLRAIYYDLMGVETREAQSDDRLCDAVFNGVHLLSGRREVSALAGSLYRCHYDAVFPANRQQQQQHRMYNSAYHTPENVVFLCASEHKRYREIAGRVGGIGAPSGGGEEEEEEDDDDIDGDEMPYHYYEESSYDDNTVEGEVYYEGEE